MAVDRALLCLKPVPHGHFLVHLVDKINSGLPILVLYAVIELKNKTRTVCDLDEDIDGNVNVIENRASIYQMLQETSQVVSNWSLGLQCLWTSFRPEFL